MMLWPLLRIAGTELAYHGMRALLKMGQGRRPIGHGSGTLLSKGPLDDVVCD